MYVCIMWSTLCLTVSFGPLPAPSIRLGLAWGELVQKEGLVPELLVQKKEKLVPKPNLSKQRCWLRKRGVGSRSDPGLWIRSRSYGPLARSLNRES